MRSAIIEKGVVVNVIAGEIPGSIECGPDVSNGWAYDGTDFTAPPVSDPTIEELRTQSSISRAKFALSAFKAKLISDQEMEDWAGGTSIPAWVADTIEGAIAAGYIPAEQRPNVRIAILTQDTIGRMDRLIPILAESVKLSPEQVDALFGINV